MSFSCSPSAMLQTREENRTYSKEACVFPYPRKHGLSEHPRVLCVRSLQPLRRSGRAEIRAGDTAVAQQPKRARAWQLSFIGQGSVPDCRAL